MALMERVSTLLRANLNDLIDRAEDPAKMIKQVILDMENQLMQVKTQVAIAVADLHVLERKRGEDAEKESSWMRKADIAVARKDDALARAAIERALSSRKMTAAFDEQVADQKVQVENLKAAFSKLEAKLAEARGKADVLAARQRRSRMVTRTADATINGDASATSNTFNRMEDKVLRSEAYGEALQGLADDDLEIRLASLEKEEEVEKLLAELKAKKGAA
ncbi:MAG TPA: PspA/IM30 family protein [Bryobacteraceae bacterium]